MLGLIFMYAKKEVDKNFISGYSYKKNKKNKSSAENEQHKKSHHEFSLSALIWNLRRVLLVNVLMFALLWVLHHPLLYLLWPKRTARKY